MMLALLILALMLLMLALLRLLLILALGMLMLALLRLLLILALMLLMLALLMLRGLSATLGRLFVCLACVAVPLLILFYIAQWIVTSWTLTHSFSSSLQMG